MVKYVLEKMEDFRRAVKENKIKRIYYTVESGFIAEGVLAANLRLSAISAEGMHITLAERITDMKFTNAPEDKQRFEDAIAAHKNKLFDNIRETMPDCQAIAGAVFP